MKRYYSILRQLWLNCYILITAFAIQSLSFINKFAKKKYIYHHLIFCRERDLREVLAININPKKDRVTWRGER